MVKIVSPTGKVIKTDVCPEIQRIIESEGIPWFEALQKPVNISENSFQKIDALISRTPS